MGYEGYIVPTPTTPPGNVKRALRRLGQDIRDARKRRGLAMQIVADRAFTSRKTIQRIEQGEYAVNIGTYAAVLNALGLLDGLAALADPVNDKEGMELASASLPKRIRSSKAESETLQTKKWGSMVKSNKGKSPGE